MDQIQSIVDTVNNLVKMCYCKTTYFVEHSESDLEHPQLPSDDVTHAMIGNHLKHVRQLFESIRNTDTLENLNVYLELYSDNTMYFKKGRPVKLYTPIGYIKLPKT